MTEPAPTATDQAPSTVVYAVELPIGYAVWLVQMLEGEPGAAGLAPDKVTVMLDRAAVEALQRRTDNVTRIRGGDRALELVIDGRAYPLRSSQ